MKKGKTNIGGIEMDSIHLEEGDLPEELETHKLTRNEPHKEPILGKVDLNLAAELEKRIGFNGRMLSGSKVAPEGQEIYWNACIFDKEGTQIWYGDFNVTTELETLEKAAKELGIKVFLTPEQPFRFDGLEKGRKVKPDKVIKVG